MACSVKQMKTLYCGIILVLFAISHAFAQKQSSTCRCFKVVYFDSCISDEAYDDVVDTLLHISGRKILLCGEINLSQDSSIIVSSFRLIISEKDTIDSFYKGDSRLHPNTSFKIHTDSDTLFIDENKLLPTGSSLEFSDILWKESKIYFKNKQYFFKQNLNRKIPKYTIDQINTLINNFSLIKQKLDACKDLDSLRNGSASK